MPVIVHPHDLLNSSGGEGWQGCFELIYPRSFAKQQVSIAVEVLPVVGIVGRQRTQAAETEVRVARYIPHYSSYLIGKVIRKEDGLVERLRGSLKSLRARVSEMTIDCGSRSAVAGSPAINGYRNAPCTMALGKTHYDCCVLPRSSGPSVIIPS